MREATIVLIFFLSFLLIKVKAQAPLPQVMPPYYINNLSVNATNGIDLYQSESIISTGNESEPVNITGTAKVDYKASKEVELKPGFTARDFAADGEFHAYIDELPFEVAWFEPTTNVGTVPKYEKLELGIKLPDGVNDKIQAFLDCNPITHNCEIEDNTINPFDPAEISIDVDFISPDNRTIRKYGFYYEEYLRHATPILFSNVVSDNTSGGIDINEPATINNGDKNDSWERLATDYNFRIRLAPDYLGDWSFSIKIWLGTTLLGEYNNSFDVVAPNPLEKGFVKLDANNKYLKYVETEAGSLFLIGENVDVFKEHIYPQSHQLHKEVIQGVIDNGGNFVELMMVPENFGIEREVMGNYASKANHLQYYNHNLSIGNNPNTNNNPDDFELTRQMNAWEFDQMLTFIEDEKIYCQIALDMPGVYVTKGDTKCNGSVELKENWSWWSMNWNPADFDYIDANGNTQHHYDAKCNPYNKLSQTNHGRTQAVVNQIDFFENAEAQKYYKRKLRYISSRWGYSPHIISYEIHGEIDQEAINICWNDANHRTIIRNWVNMASTYLKDDLQDPHLLTFSSVNSHVNEENAYYNDQPFNLPKIDLINYSMYNYYGQRNFAFDKAGLFEMHKNYFPGKAEFFGEYGCLDVIECDDIGYHNDLWAGAFMGNIGTPNHWDWNKHFHYDRFNNLSALSQFMNGIDFEWNNFLPKRDASDDVEMFYLINNDGVNANQAMGWVHNRSAYWANVINPNGLEANCYFEVGDEDYYCPVDVNGNITDPDCIPLQNNVYDLGPSIIAIDGLDDCGESCYTVQWYNTITGEEEGSPDYVVEVFGDFVFNVPAMPEEGPYDWSYKIQPEGEDFKSIASGNNGFDTLTLCMQDEIIIEKAIRDTLNYRITGIKYSPENSHRIYYIGRDELMKKQGFYEINYIDFSAHQSINKKLLLLVKDCQMEDYRSGTLISNRKQFSSENADVDILDSKYGISVNPNPTTGIVTMSLKGVDYINSVFSIYNTNGELLINETSIPKNTVRIDISNYPQGIYLVKAETVKSIFYTKIIKI